MYVGDEGSPIAISFLATFDGYPIYIQDWWERSTLLQKVMYQLNFLYNVCTGLPLVPASMWHPTQSKQFPQWNLLLVVHLDIEMSSWNPLLSILASIEALLVFSHFWLNLNSRRPSDPQTSITFRRQYACQFTWPPTKSNQPRRCHKACCTCLHKFYKPH